jgi:hypothetical protein
VGSERVSMQMRFAEILLDALDQFAHPRAIRLRPGAEFASQIWIKISAIKLLRLSPGTLCCAR